LQNAWNALCLFEKNATPLVVEDQQDDFLSESDIEKVFGAEKSELNDFINRNDNEIEFPKLTSQQIIDTVLKEDSNEQSKFVEEANYSSENKVDKIVSHLEALKSLDTLTSYIEQSENMTVEMLAYLKNIKEIVEHDYLESLKL